MPSRGCQAGDTVFVRATVLEPCGDTGRVLIEDRRQVSIAIWLPACEIAHAEHIGDLKPVPPGAAWRRFLAD